MLTYFDNLGSRKRNYSFAKSLEKILNIFGSKKSLQTLETVIILTLTPFTYPV